MEHLLWCFTVKKGLSFDADIIQSLPRLSILWWHACCVLVRKSSSSTTGTSFFRTAFLTLRYFQFWASLKVHFKKMLFNRIQAEVYLGCLFFVFFLRKIHDDDFSLFNLAYYFWLKMLFLNIILLTAIPTVVLGVIDCWVVFCQSGDFRTFISSSTFWKRNSTWVNHNF